MGGVTQTIPENINEIGLLSERISEKVITEIQQEKVKTEISTRTEQMLLGLIEDKYPYDNLKKGLLWEEVSKEVKSQVYNLWGKEIIRLLEEDASKKRLMSRRSMAAAHLKTETNLRDGGKALLKKKSKEEANKDEDEITSVKKMTLDEIGQEIAAREESEKQLQAQREKEEQEIQAERTRHSKAYQYAFNMFAEAINLISEGDAASLIDCVNKMGDENFTARQMAAEKIVNEPRLNLAFHALHAALNDKVIVHKTIQSVAKIGDFRVVETLLGIIRENSGAKESTIRGLAEKSIGDILQSMNAKKKGSGLKKLYLLVRDPKFEKHLSSMISILKRDIESSQMHKYYLTPLCLKSILTIAQKLTKDKKKEVRIIFLKFLISTPLSKEIFDLIKLIENNVKVA